MILLHFNHCLFGCICFFIFGSFTTFHFYSLSNSQFSKYISHLWYSVQILIHVNVTKNHLIFHILLNLLTLPPYHPQRNKLKQGLVYSFYIDHLFDNFAGSIVCNCFPSLCDSITLQKTQRVLHPLPKSLAVVLQKKGDYFKLTKKGRQNE